MSRYAKTSIEFLPSFSDFLYSAMTFRAHTFHCAPVLICFLKLCSLRNSQKKKILFCCELPETLIVSLRLQRHKHFKMIEACVDTGVSSPLPVHPDHLVPSLIPTPLHLSAHMFV